MEAHSLTVGVLGKVGSNESAVSWFKAGVGLAVTSLIAFLSYAAQQINSVSDRVTKLETASFTASRGEELKDMVQELKLQVAKIPTENPPGWLLSDFRKYQEKVDRLEQRDIKK